jgi:hypothetical protein
LAKGGEILGTIAEHITNQSSYSWNIPEDLEPGNDYTIVIEDGIISGQSEAFTLSDERVDRYTEYFTETQNLFDLSNKSVLFVPVDGDSYRAIAQDIEKLPESSTTGKTLRLGDDDSILVPLTLSRWCFMVKVIPGFMWAATAILPSVRRIRNIAPVYRHIFRSRVYLYYSTI